MANTGLLNPKNVAPESSGGFKEGFVRVDSSVFKVVKPNAPAGQVARPDFTALVWGITRLDEGSMEPLTDEHDTPITETLSFGCGAKSISSNQVHPGKADNPDDDEIEDAGVEPGSEGPTLLKINESWAPNSKSGIAYLYNSLAKVYDEKHIDRVWAPDHVGGVFFMKSIAAEGEGMAGTDGKLRPVMMKVVDKMVKAGYSTAVKGAGAKATSKDTATAPAKASSDPNAAAAEASAKTILETLSTELDGQQLTLKRLNMKVSESLKSTGVDAKLHVPVLALVKDTAGWLAKNAKKFDMTVDTEENTVVFGELAK